LKEQCYFQWFGQRWECTRGVLEDTTDGGECDVSTKHITIDIEQDAEEFLTSLHHELIEGACYLIGCSYNRPYPDSQDMYLMSHSNMDLMSSTVRGAYESIKMSMDARPGDKASPKSKPSSVDSKKNRKKPVKKRRQ